MSPPTQLGSHRRDGFQANRGVEASSSNPTVALTAPPSPTGPQSPALSTASTPSPPRAGPPSGTSDAHAEVTTRATTRTSSSPPRSSAAATIRAARSPASSATSLSYPGVTSSGTTMSASRRTSRPRTRSPARFNFPCSSMVSQAPLFPCVSALTHPPSHRPHPLPRDRQGPARDETQVFRGRGSPPSQRQRGTYTRCRFGVSSLIASPSHTLHQHARRRTTT